MKPNSCVWIIIPTFNRSDILSECISSLKKQLYKNIKIIVVDDKSSDDTIVKLKDLYPDVYILSGDGNRWWSGCMNIGLSYIMSNSSPFDYIVSFNDDVLVSEEYITQLVASYDNNSNLMVGSVALDSDDNSKIVFNGNTINWAIGKWKGKPASRSRLNSLSLIGSDSLPGRGTIFPVALVKDIGFYNDKYFPQYFGDEDFSLRAKENGYQLYVNANAKVLSHVKMTGTGRHSPSFFEFIASLFSIRSPNQLSRRIKFAIRHCPIKYKLQFILIDMLKVMTAYFRLK